MRVSFVDMTGFSELVKYGRHMLSLEVARGNSLWWKVPIFFRRKTFVIEHQCCGDAHDYRKFYSSLCYSTGLVTRGSQLLILRLEGKEVGERHESLDDQARATLLDISKCHKKVYQAALFDHSILIEFKEILSNEYLDVLYKYEKHLRQHTFAFVTDGSTPLSQRAIYSSIADWLMCDHCPSSAEDNDTVIAYVCYRERARNLRKALVTSPSGEETD